MTVDWRDQGIMSTGIIKRSGAGLYIVFSIILAIFSGCSALDGSFEGDIPADGSSSAAVSFTGIRIGGSLSEYASFYDHEMYWFGESRPVIWDNSGVTVLDTDIYQRGEVRTIISQGTDIFAGGCLYNEQAGESTDARACFWKNSLLTVAESVRSNINASAADGTSLFFCGYYRDDNGTSGDETDDRNTACYWDYTGETLTRHNVLPCTNEYESCEVTDIEIDADYIYMTVNRGESAYYYRFNRAAGTEANSQELIRELQYSGPPYRANGISVSGGYAYIAGTYTSSGSSYIRAVYWKVPVGGSTYELTDLPRCWNSSMANDILVDGNVLYISGWDELGYYQNACLWKQILGEQDLPVEIGLEAENESETLKICKSGYAVYITGYYMTRGEENRMVPCFWRNRTRYDLTTGQDEDSGFSSAVTFSE